MTGADRPVGPVIVRRRLGNELRRLREDANMRLDAVAAELEVSPSKISRIETGHSTAKTWDVRNLLTLYGVVDDQRRDVILAWASDAKAQVWWQDAIPESPHEITYYISLEAEARLLQAYCSPVLHALLQTDDYDRAHTRSFLPDLDDDAVERLVEVGSRRRASVLHQTQAFDLVAIIDEPVLHRHVGSEPIMRDQLRHLLALPANVELRVRPLSAGPHRAILSPFTIFTPRVPDLDPVVVAVEAALTDSHVERPDATSRYQVAFHELRDSALDPQASRAFIDRLIDQ